MRMLAAIAVLLLPCLFAQTPVKPEDLCSIDGKITNDVTGDPIQKALVILTPGPAAGAIPLPPVGPGDRGAPSLSSVTQTDAEGHYHLEGVMPGWYRMVSQKPGFMTSAYGPRAPLDSTVVSAAVSAPLELTPGRKLTKMDLKLRPFGAIAGRILDTDGEPMWHAQVGVYRWGYSNSGVRELHRIMDGDTDDLGEYRLSQLPPGRYAVCAYGPGAPNGVERSARPASESYVTTCYAGSDIAEGATLVTVQPGQTVAATNFKMIKRTVSLVRGRVTNPTGAMPRGAVRLFSLSNPLIGTRYPGVGPKGEFEIAGVPAGNYRVMAMSNSQAAEEDIQVSDRPVEVALTLGAGVALQGTLGVENDAPLASPVIISIFDQDIGVGWGGTRVTEPGNFQLRQVSRGHLQLRFGVPAGYYVKSARMRERDVLVNGLDLTDGRADPLEIVLGQGVASIAGTVRNNKDELVPGATVLVAPKETDRRKRLDEYRSFRSDASGNFQVSNLPPGEYILYAWTAVEDRAWLNEEYMRTLGGNSVSVSASANGSYNVNLKVIAPEVRQ